MHSREHHLQEYCERSASLSRDGFTVLNAFLCSEEIEEIKRFLETAMRLPQDSTCKRPHNTLIPLRWNDRIVQRVLLSESRLGRLRDVAQGDDLKWISGYISSKEAFSPPLWWHQDWWCWDHPVSYRGEAAQIALLCYLTDTTIENGALRVLPGSHLESAPIHSILPEAHSQTAETIQSEHSALGDLAGQVTLDLKAGDGVVLDYRLLHGTHGNSTLCRRDCILLSFTPAWRRLPEDIRAHLVDHPALPLVGEAVEGLPLLSNLLPRFEGERRSLQLNRNAPVKFKVSVDAVSGNGG